MDEISADFCGGSRGGCDPAPSPKYMDYPVHLGARKNALISSIWGGSNLMIIVIAASRLPREGRCHE